MKPVRAAILTLGPLCLLAGCYWLTVRCTGEPLPAAWKDSAESALKRVSPTSEAPPLEVACYRRAANVLSQLNADCRALVRVPYVLGGDLSHDELQRHYRQTILPTEKALSTSYFDHPPEQPITILMFSSEETYRDHALRFDGRPPSRYYGYYHRAERRMLLNLATGNGTLAHELTHALAHCDFPNIPEWLDEGLAALHEQCLFSQDGRRLLGVSNWRLHYLLPALRAGELRPLEELVSAGQIRPGKQAVDYAHARYFCLFLQQQGLLSAYYRKVRAAAETDPTGLGTLRRLFAPKRLAEVDRAFRQWVRQQAARSTGMGPRHQSILPTMSDWRRRTIGSRRLGTEEKRVSTKRSFAK